MNAEDCELSHLYSENTLPSQPHSSISYLEGVVSNNIVGADQPMTDCVFCQILDGKLEASLVYSDDKAVAFMDIQPVNPGHTLVIPRTHAPFMSELDEESGAHMFKVGMRVSGAVRKSGVRCEGVNLHLADGEIAGQEIFHVHLHVIPRFTGDWVGLKFGAAHKNRPSRESLNGVAQQIRSAMLR